MSVKYLPLLRRLCLQVFCLFVQQLIGFDEIMPDFDKTFSDLVQSQVEPLCHI